MQMVCAVRLGQVGQGGLHLGHHLADVQISNMSLSTLSISHLIMVHGTNRGHQTQLN